MLAWPSTWKQSFNCYFLMIEQSTGHVQVKNMALAYIVPFVYICMYANDVRIYIKQHLWYLIRGVNMF